MKPRTTDSEFASHEDQKLGPDPLVQFHIAIWTLIQDVGREDVAIFAESLPQDIRERVYDDNPYECTCVRDGGR